MTADERRILCPLASGLRLEHASAWADLKYQTQHAPELVEFPYYPATIEFNEPGQNAMAGLGDGDQAALLKAWQSKLHDPCSFTGDDRIIDLYGAVLQDLIETRARSAGARSSSFSGARHARGSSKR